MSARKHQPGKSGTAKSARGFDSLAKQLRAEEAPSRLAASELSSSIGFLLRLANGVSQTQLSARLDALGLRQSLYSVMLIIHENPGLKQQEVGQTLSIQQPNLVALINDLVGRGLVLRGVNDQDRRSYSLQLTPAGEKLLVKANRSHAEFERVLADAIAPLSVDEVRKALLRIVEIPST